ncbi:uncharacterized protein LOC113453199 [Pseudonaja textilis]|uniref:uncharacterized protein LOC113453199 n=1 Tax=Pseudonaja textilis TaxID=8673 RepID=UPI000EA86A9D|nr:uncharacterized protein LOC113453199 [Pseudonaja textilis]
MKAPLVCFLLLAVTFATATEWDTDGIVLQAKGQVEQQNPEPPTDDTSGKKHPGRTGPPSYGQCPPTIAIVPQDYYCQLGGPCPGDEKCCQIGRMTKCILPKGVHHRYCPRPQDQAVYNKLCTGDYQCGQHEKCCSTEGHKKCVAAVAGVAGVCPKKRLPRGPTHMQHRCFDDRECDSGKKCCLDEHGLSCVYPEGFHRSQDQNQDQDQDQDQNQDQNQNQNQNQNQDQTGEEELGKTPQGNHWVSCCPTASPKVFSQYTQHTHTHTPGWPLSSPHHLLTTL